MCAQKYPGLYPTPPEPGMQPLAATAPPQPHQIFPRGGWLPPSTTYLLGLDSLINLDYLFVDQKTELLQVFTGCQKNKYAITDNKGEMIYYVVEKSRIFSRLCLGKYRSCKFRIYDRNRREVLRMVRPFRFDSCCCPCYLQVLEVYSGDTLLGSVTQEWSLWRPIFNIRNASGQPVLKIKGPLIRFCVEVTFKITTMDEKHHVGVIQKQWSGFTREFFTVSDKFGINFPLDLDMKIKAVLLGACLLIDFMFFEQQN